MDDVIVTFRNCEAAYLRWLQRHPWGYVINTTRSSPHNYMRLHRATCWHISRYPEGAEPGGFTGRDYIKVCSSTKPGVERWAAQWGTSIKALGGCYCLNFS
jgi:hypothetical protein